MKSLRKTIYFTLLLFLSSCSDNLNFNQLDDLVITPVYTSSLAYFTILPFQFFDETGTVQQSEISDISGFRVFENIYIKNNLVRIDFNVEVKNEFERDFTLNVEFLDDNNNITYKFSPLNIDATNLDYTYLEEIDVVANKNIKNTTQVKINARIENSTTPLNASDTKEFEFKSAVTLYIEKDI